MKITNILLLAITLFVMNSCQWDLVCNVDQNPVVEPPHNNPNKTPYCTKSCKCPDEIIDNRDGFTKRYKTIWIDTLGGSDTALNGQCWMKQNLYVGKLITDYSLMLDRDTIIEKFCNNTKGVCDSTLGGYYSWNEAMNWNYSDTFGVRGICPLGWHLPSRKEFDRLAESLKSPANFIFKFKIEQAGFVSIFQNKPVFDFTGAYSFYWTSNPDFTVNNSKIWILEVTDRALIKPDGGPAFKDFSNCIRCIQNY
jgi:uncharacterized protein (TIGR02145 family)